MYLRQYLQLCWGSLSIQTQTNLKMASGADHPKTQNQHFIKAFSGSTFKLRFIYMSTYSTI